jgi:hypothetical protein
VFVKVFSQNAQNLFDGIKCFGKIWAASKKRADQEAIAMGRTNSNQLHWLLNNRLVLRAGRSRLNSSPAWSATAFLLAHYFGNLSDIVT